MAVTVVSNGSGTVYLLDQGMTLTQNRQGQGRNSEGKHEEDTDPLP